MKSVTLNSNNQKPVIKSIYHQNENQLETERLKIEEAKSNPAAFEFLYNKYYEQIFRYVYQRVDDFDNANDITSQIFLKAMNKLSSYEFKGVPFSSWLYRIAQSEVYSSFKKSKTVRTINIETQDLKSLTDNDDENVLLEFKEQLIDAIKELKDTDIQMIEMRFFEKRPFKEIAEILELTESNAKVKAHRALEKLRTIFFKKVNPNTL